VDQSKKPVRNTKQRKYMLELLHSTDTHPNAFWLFEKMKLVFQNLSLSTVYRNLGILESQGLLQRLSCGASFDRYDANVSLHSHFYCRHCHQVYDLNAKALEDNALDSANAGSHQLEGCQITFYGICDQCISNNSNNERMNES